ncbi:MAG: pyridoxal phosphate-dependent aminotransferase [Candidatus Euphemobacter frigidus]|nr:pyridoxal phosphate-dependent aminotransferase [Candidatus Euphemobacter frigidus]MDP8274952.1 pyridoxal phosphate-dependent aminotransferase [Candidatus Euphemobacter frigidus]
MNVSPRLRRISPSLTLEITSRAKALQKAGVDIINFAAGEPDFETPEHIKAAARSAIDRGKTHYTPAKGMPELIEAVREKFKRDNGLEYSAGQIIISCGAKHSLYNAFQAICREGDEVIIPSPYWVTYPEQVRLSGAEPVFLETAEEVGFRIDRERLKSLITPHTRALIISSPCNPTGCGYPREDLEYIADLALKEDFILISDEIYEKLTYDNFQVISIASLSREIQERTIVINGVSKSYAMTGWRIGYLAAPEEVAKAISSFQSHSTSNPATPSQFAALAALQGDQSCVEEMRKTFEERRDLMMDRLSGITGLACQRPVGTFYVFPNISFLNKSSREITAELLNEAKIAVVPGIAFGRDTNIRMSFAASAESLGKGLDRFEEYARRR